MKKIQDHKFLKILRFAVENDYFTQNEMCEALDLTADEFINYSQMSSIIENAHQLDDNRNSRYKMRYDAFRDYLDYIELKDTRASSKSARRIAISALVVTSILALASICLSLYQIWHPTNSIIIK